MASGQYTINDRMPRIDSAMAGYDSASSGQSSLSRFSTDSRGKKHVKRLPGETREQAVERDLRDKEKKRLTKLLRLAYPRQREAHLIKAKLLMSPEESSLMHDLYTLKKESIR